MPSYSHRPGFMRSTVTLILALLLGFLMAGGLLAQDATGETSEEAAPKDANGQAEWIQTIDGWFGDYLVTPLDSVLFFPIHTQETEIETTNEVTGDTGTSTITTKIPFIVIWLFVGATFFTLVMGFINLRGFKHAVKLTKGDYDNPDDPGEVTHFQALSSALSGTVGLGNIAGVAIAIGQGGPGATFWIILVGLLGMTSKFTECTLGQMYRKVDGSGKVSGGPMRYLSDGLKEMKLGPLGVVLAGLFALLCLGGALGGGNTFQISQSLDAIRSDVPIVDERPWLYGLVMVTLIGLVVIGGIKSIGKVASRIVPFMCAGYVLCALYILGSHIGEIPAAFGSIFAGAFSTDAMYGGFLGCLVIGIKRAVFSNEAGAGSAAIAHSAAKTDIPVREGFVALLEPFIDTVVVCTMTALVIIITGVCDKPYNSVDTQILDIEIANSGLDPADFEGKSDEEKMAAVLKSKPALDADSVDEIDADGNPVKDEDGNVNQIPDGVLTTKDYIDKDRGAFFTRVAFTKGGHEWFKWFLYVAVFLFAFSTCISWFYYGERCFTTLFGEKSSIIFKVIFLSFTFLGSIVATTNIKDFSDMLILGMAFPNMLGMYFLCWRVRRHLNEYWEGVKAGKYDRK